MNAIYGIGHFLSQCLFDVFFRGEIAGHENIPPSGAFILAANHASFFDPPAIGCRVSRQMHYFARKTLFKPGLPAKILHQVNTIPVDLENEGDISALKTVFRVLKTGGSVLLFPEGTRTYDGKLRSPQSGVGMIACKSGVPVVPCRIFGSYEAYGRHHPRPNFNHPLDIAFGPLLHPKDYDKGGKSKERYGQASQTIMAAIARIPPPPTIQL